MSETERKAELDVEGPAAPPRQNGELVFENPWESRAFGMAVTLHQRGYFEWPEFQKALIAEIAAWDQAHPDKEGYDYYARWLAALEKVLASKDLCATSDLDERHHEFACRPHGHDH